MLNVINNEPQYKKGTCYLVNRTEDSGKAELTDSKNRWMERVSQLYNWFLFNTFWSISQKWNVFGMEMLLC